MSNPLFSNDGIIITLIADETLEKRIAQLSQAGFTQIEVLTQDIARLKAIKQTFSVTLGAGMVVNTQQLEDCYLAGIDFVTSPGFLASLVQTASIYNMNYFPGVATLSEAMQVNALGCKQARPFPASISFCHNLCQYLPELKQVPANIEWNEAEQYLSIPNVASVSIDELNCHVKLADQAPLL